MDPLKFKQKIAGKLRWPRNPEFNPKLIHTEKSCPECNDLVTDRVVQFYKKIYTDGRNVWIKKCLNCRKKWPDPIK